LPQHAACGGADFLSAKLLGLRTRQRRRNAERLALLKEQRSDLAGCLDALWSEILQGTRRFKLYRQMKMYNDPELNPAVYGRK